MRFAIDTEDDRPASRQLHDRIVDAVERGRLVAGERLPPVRELAQTIGVAPNTVAKAYRTLVTEGYLQARGRGGTFVAARAPHLMPRADRHLAEAADRFIRRGRHLGFDDAEILRATRSALRVGGDGAGR